MKSNTLQRITVLLAVVATLVVNGLANTLPLNGLSTGEISDRFEVYFVPAGYVFSIWGLIYLGLIAYGVYQGLPAQRDDTSLQDIGWLFVASCAANVAWLFLWHYEQFTWTILAMLTLLVLLILIYERLWQVRDTAGSSHYWFVQLPFSIYLGWITVATVANATSLLDFLGWSGWGIADVAWAVVMLLIAMVVGVAFILRRRDPAYGLVLVWAFAGIAIKHTGTSTVALTAWITAGIVMLTVLYQLLVPRLKRDRPDEQIA
jgi:benzodiazapine receptor